MKALLLVGLQIDLLPGGPAEVAGSQSIVQDINQLAPRYDFVVAANFSLPADHVMFAASHLWRKPGQTISINGSTTLLHHIFCVPGSFGAEMIPGLRAEIAYTALMGTDGLLPPHSAFFDAGQKRSTGLADFLAAQKTTELHIAGMPLETTVQHSLEDALALGFNAAIVPEACRSNSPLPAITQ